MNSNNLIKFNQLLNDSKLLHDTLNYQQFLQICDINDKLNEQYKINKYNKKLKNEALPLIHSNIDKQDKYKLLNAISDIDNTIKNSSHSIYKLTNQRNNIINKINIQVKQKKPSKHELFIIYILNILIKYNIISYFEWEKVLPVKYKINLRADLFIIDSHFNEFIIEYDGLHHYQIGFFIKTEFDLLEQKKRDSIKNNYCKNNHISMTRIPYTTSLTQIQNIILDLFHCNKPSIKNDISKFIF